MWTTRKHGPDTIAVYDGPVYIGLVYELSNKALKSNHMNGPTFANKNDAVFWLVEEHRETPWADREEQRRVTA